MDEVGDGHALDLLAVGDEVDRHVPPEGRRLGVEDIRLAGVRREVDGHRVPGIRLVAAVHLELAADLGTVVLEVDLDGRPGARSGMALEQHAGVHVQRPGGGARDRQGAQDDGGDGEERPEPERDARARGLLGVRRP